MERAVRKPSSLVIAALGCLGLGSVSLLLPSGPTYDSYQWLIWGRELAHFHLDTMGSGTSWKPFPALVAAFLAPLGHAQAAAWLAVARAGGLFAAFMAFRVAARLAGPRYAWTAGIAAALTFVLTREVFLRTSVGLAEALTAALALLAIERHLDGKQGQAFALGVVVALGRPESWPFLLAYGIWLWTRPERRSRWALAAGAALVPLCWFGGDWLGSGHAFNASDTALHTIPNSPGAASDPALAVVQLAWRMLPVPAHVLLPAAAVIAGAGLVRARREGRPRDDRDVIVLVLAGAAVVWTAIVVVMAVRGYAGLGRYLFPADALAAVVVGVGVARVAALAPSRGRRLRPAVGFAALLAFAAFAVPDALKIPADVTALAQTAHTDDGLSDAVGKAGGPSGVFRCGRPYTGWWTVTALAYDLGVGSAAVDDHPHGRSPIVFIPTYRDPGLKSPLPRRHMRVAGVADGWEIYERCAAPARSVRQPAPRVEARAGSRSHGRRAAHT